MKENNFTDHFDPTTPLDLSGIDVRKQYSNLTEREKLLVFCKINGFNRIPPTIREFWENPYYLGSSDFFDGGSNLYDYWKDKLEMIYPSPVTTSKYTELLLSAIGTGKSTVSRLMMAYTHARMLCMDNPSRTLRLTPKPFSYVVYHRDEEVARREFKYWFTQEALVKSPFFKTVRPNFKFQVLTSGPLGQAGLGSDVLVYIISEINFFPNAEKAQNIVATAFGRFSSRFDDRVTSMIGHIILDSSPAGNNGPTEWLIDQMDPEKMWICRGAHYEVKPDSYKASQGKTFPIWTGDGKTPPQILPMDYKLEVDQDPKRVINVPIQLMTEAKMNLTKLLQDKCGISTGASDSFFGGNVKPLSDCFTKKLSIPEVIKVDFYDKTDKIYDKIVPALSEVKPTSTIWLGLDLATTSDYTGISAVQFDEWKYIEGVKYPKIKVLFTIALSRKSGQETSLYHIFDFIVTLSKDYNVIVSADQAYSKQILQDCEREGIKTNGRISTDNVPCEPALYLKNMILLSLINLPENKRLLREAYDLRYVPTGKGYKIDHPKKATQNTSIFDINDGRGSKDVWDSLCSACYSLKMSIDSGEESGYSNGVDKQLKAIKSLTSDVREESYKAIQDMIETIY